MDELLVSTVSDFARREILRVADRIDRDDLYPRELILKMGELGILDPLHYGAELLDSMICLEEIAKVSGSVALLQDVQGELVNAPLRKYGRDQDLTEELARGKTLGSFALSEPCCGSDTSSMRSVARKVNGTWRIDGEKMWITQGLYANVFLVAARNDEGKISAYLVRDTQCVEREKIEVQGNRGTGTAKIRMNDCEGELVGGWEVVKYALSVGRIAISAISLGLALGAVEEAYNWAKERQAFGKRLTEHEGIAWMFSDSIAELESARALLEVTCNAFTRDWRKAEPLISSLKLVSSGIANRVVDRMVQVMGGMGYAKLTRVERAYRDVRLTRIGEGTDEVQRMILSRHVEELIHEL
ncbi:Crotonobetainyl-CoA dehydrogenase [Metallosphaera sp. J1]|uniref:acyl-CoA dehydrogenase family protein n=1 Tax=Metallosphaera TaxID=41980 RepID=UPI001EDF039D|nr:acyl-CoA dehydrogenase family protein [Metallosphaera javensis (ex Hofmann et al. 2022)]MCG3108930.1 Crotonobetainyl-CoA dehydrogenase [Metallosphaera javensis (ex Hofmann et al. 2022)]BCS92284.1 MAG: acyl-CoA dehydrogenase [Metallosphaera javensis (ex Sakai et al. 2022)]